MRGFGEGRRKTVLTKKEVILYACSLLFFTFISKQLRHNEVSLSASKGKVARRRRYKANAEGREGEIPLFSVGLGFNYTA